MTSPSSPVVVGVDTFPPSLEAALWAAAEATRRCADLHLVMVNDEAASDGDLWDRLHDVSAQCGQQHPQLEISERLFRGHPAAELIRRSLDAQLVVVGSRSQDEPAGWLGSVSTAVATRAHCPVTVVHAPHTEYTTGSIVVGYDHSQQGRNALRFAIEAAALYDTDVLVVLVLRDIHTEYTWTEPSIIDINWKRWQDEALRDLGTKLSEWSAEYPDATLRKEVLRGYPIEELSNAGSNGQMLVVGHRGLGGIPGLLLGSVASGVLHHAPCPVTVVH